MVFNMGVFMEEKKEYIEMVKEMEKRLDTVELVLKVLSDEIKELKKEAST